VVTGAVVVVTGAVVVGLGAVVVTGAVVAGVVVVALPQLIINIPLTTTMARIMRSKRLFIITFCLLYYI
jgi:hypothetical protein